MEQMCGFVSTVAPGRASPGGGRAGQCVRSRVTPVVGLFGGGNKPKDPSQMSRREIEMEEEYQRMQATLARRRKKDENAKYFEEVEERRKKVEEDRKKTKFELKEGEDPLIEWKKLQERGDVKPLGYENEPEGGIPIPMASFQIPRYDNGMRFDLRLPYADKGYEDPDADFMGKLKKMFGMGKKSEPKDSSESQTK
mmetsp:Transcript_49466/g.121438  ORF Transcript_49466/g.121438 Transcript_49466/m.121438 type:complete len:196 (-) Transcript_49466:236-823(-)